MQPDLMVPIFLVCFTAGLGRFAFRLTRRASSTKRIERIHAVSHPNDPDPSPITQRPKRSLTKVRSRTRAEADLLAALAMIGRSVHAGSSMASAIDAAARAASSGMVGNGLRQVSADAPRIGLVGALQAWGTADPNCARTAWALSIAAETGGDPLSAVDSLTSSIRSEGSLTRELGALTAQSTLSAAVLAVVPIGFGGLLSGTDPQARHFLFASSVGRACLVVGLLLDLIAWRWLRRIGQVSV